MSPSSYGKTTFDNSHNQHSPSFNQFISQLPHVTISELEAMAEMNNHLVEQIPRYISQMVGYECRLIGF